MSFPIEKLMKKELQRILKSYGQPTSGRKVALEDRLRQHLSKEGEKPRHDGSDDDFEDDDGTTTPHTRFSSDHDERLQELQAQMEAIEEASKSRRAQRNAAELELARQEQEDYQSEYQRIRLQAELDVLRDETMQEQHAAAQYSMPYASAKTVKFKHQQSSTPVQSKVSRGQRRLDRSISPRGARPKASQVRGTVDSTYRPIPAKSSGASATVNRAASTYIPRQPAVDISMSSQNSESMLLQQQMLEVLTLPKPQLMQFDGDPLKFHLFLNLFDSAIHDTNISDAAKLNRLLDLCKGKALKVVQSCALYHPSVGYPKARELLIKRFGNDFDIAESYVSKIVTGSQIGNNNVAALQDFCDDVRGCTETLRAMERLDEVDTRSRLVKLVQRLPYHLQTRWRKVAVDQRIKKGTYPNIDDFLEFLEGATLEK